MENNKPILKILIGVSGSGKSTWAANYMKTYTEYYPVMRYFNRDELRISFLKSNGYKPHTLKTYYKIWQPKIQTVEKQITKVGEWTIRDCIKQYDPRLGTLLIFDTTMLKPEYLERVLKVADNNYDVRLVIFKLPSKWKLMWRLFWRDGITNFKYLNKQIEDYHKMVEYIKNHPNDYLIQYRP